MSTGGVGLRQLLPYLILIHLLASFTFFVFFLPKGKDNTTLASGLVPKSAEQLRIDQLVKELEATRALLHEQHSAHDLIFEPEGGHGHGHDHSEETEGAPAPSKKKLAFRYPTSGEPLEVKQTPSVDVEPDGGFNGKPFFSIVLAAYNQGKFLEETWKSILAQTYDRWEIVLVNDGSTDDTWEIAEALMSKHHRHRIRLIRKRNGGLADARNIGLGYAKGNWLCMLDSDDLLGRDYLQRAADFVLEDDSVDIVPGCMHNFDAVDSEWCFPEGFSTVGIAHWNKFHASVLMARRLMASIGGYDPGIPWGLEDWNYWLNTVPHNPVVRFVPETTFYYRHHAGTSMRKKMFALYLEQTKAMVRTNHARLYEPVQIMHDHGTIMRMHSDTLEKLEEKIAKFPTLPMPYFWRGLHRINNLQNAAAIGDMERALQFTNDPSSLWQINYRLALLYEAQGDMVEAERAINVAFKHSYCDEILQTKHRVEGEMKMQADGNRPMVIAGHVTTQPTYWGSPKEQEDIRTGTLAGKLLRLGRLDEELKGAAAASHRMLALMRTASAHPCPPFSGPRAGDRATPISLVENGAFEESGNAWFAYGSGFELDAVSPRAGTASEQSVTMVNKHDTDVAGAMQVVFLRQDQPSPVLVKAWSRAKNVGGSPDGGYGLYIDINFADETHEWGFSLPFSTGTHKWEEVSAYLDYNKPILSLDVYCMFRHHEGQVWFDDVTVAPASKVTCQCRLNEAYDPAPNRECRPCPEGKHCMLGDALSPMA